MRWADRDHMEREVRPHVLDAWVDETDIGQLLAEVTA